MTLRWSKLLATVGGVGFLPLAPGTWGAAVGTLLLFPYMGANGLFFWGTFLVFILIFTWWGAKIAHNLAPEWGEDPKQFVLDEAVGVWVSLIGHAITGPHLLLGFLLFRVFDIWKPLGIRRFEAVPRGWGVMLDDVAAGVYANLVLWAIHYGWAFYDTTL